MFRRIRTSLALLTALAMTALMILSGATSPAG